MAKASARGMKAYVLIETAAGKTKNVKKALAKMRSASHVENTSRTRLATSRREFRDVRPVWTRRGRQTRQVS